MKTPDALVGNVAEKAAGDSPEAVALEQAVRMASRAQMLAVIHSLAAHDFRDALNSLTVNVELLARASDGRLDAAREAEVRERCLNALRQEIKRLTQSTGGVLDATRKREEPGSRVSLSSVIADVLEGLRGRLQRHRIRTLFDPPASRIEVFGQADELRHAIFNLVTNAVDAMPEGGQLTIALNSEDPTALISVSDTGPGIADKFEPDVWRLFQSTKVNGLGLGLYVVRAIVTAHGGTVSFVRGGSGVTCVVRLPLVQ